jgi:tRNA(Arg) A34 adenosine deaminase TadA
MGEDHAMASISQLLDRNRAFAHAVINHISRAAARSGAGRLPAW